jgi:hypothetical protein
MFSPAPASAQSTNATPDLAKSEAPFDGAKLAGLPGPAKQAVTQAMSQLKSGEIADFVFAASPDMKIWALKAAPKAMADSSVANRTHSALVDLARTTLETCEYGLGKPCAILSVNGFDSLKGGGWMKQPDMLSSRPSDFDPSVVPFMPAAGRPETAAYQKASGPRAFALTPKGGWLWRGGTTLGQAIDKTLADCAAQFKDTPCILYAVNNRVVFGSR